MTERSYFWEHGATGDAALSPYTSDEFNFFHITSLIGYPATEAYIIPYYENNLEVVAAGTGQHSVAVKAGAAIVDTYLYILDETLTLPIDSVGTGFYRWDKIVLRFDQTSGNPQIRLAVLKGTEVVGTGYAVLPTLTQTSGIYEVALADIYVSSTFATDIYAINDQRRFLYTATSRQKTGGYVGNLLPNSEFIAYSGLGVSGIAPDGWNATSCSSQLYTGSMGSGRSRYVMINDGVSVTHGGIRTTVFAGGSSVFTLAGRINTQLSGNFIIYIRGRRKDGSLSATEKRWSSNYLHLLEEYFQLTINFPEDDIVSLEVDFSGLNGTNSIVQPILVSGYHPGLARAVKGTIPSNTITGDAAWTADAKSSGTTTIDLTASFSDAVSVGAKAVILQLRGRDSASNAAANCYMQILGYAAPFDGVYGTLHLEGVTNDNWREARCIVPVDQIYYATGTGGAQFRIVIAASGAGTFDATVGIVGVIT